MIKRQAQFGLTLLEMMMTLSILAITFSLVMPSAQSLLTRNRITAELNQTSTLLQSARQQAFANMQTVVVCPSSNFSTCQSDWSQPKIVFVDSNNNAVADNNETIIKSMPQSTSGNLVSSQVSAIKFYGHLNSASPATLLFCDRSLANNKARALFVSLQGRVTISRDTNSDGVYEKNNGDALSCD